MCRQAPCGLRHFRLSITFGPKIAHCRLLKEPDASLVSSNLPGAHQAGANAITPSARALHGLDWLNFFLADVQTGVGPFLAIYLAGYGWNEQRVGLALTVGGIAGILTQTPAGALVDRLRSKRALIAAGIVALAAGAMLIAFVPGFWSVMAAQAFIGGTSSIFAPAICAISLGIVGHRLFDLRQGRNQTFNSGGNVVAAVSMDLHGVGPGIFGVVSVLVIADLTQGTGRFNLTLGAISTAVGIGASLSQVIAGSIVHRWGYNTGFLFLGAVALAAFGILYLFMPETRGERLVGSAPGAPLKDLA
jgi:MFS family permease